MSDQADGLRQLLRARPVLEPPPEPSLTARPRVLVFAGGKGGVGTSNLALNLALALSRPDRRVVLIDADWGRTDLEVLAGLSPTSDLGDVLTGRCSVAGTLTPGPGGIRLIAGAHGVRTPGEVLVQASAQLVAQLSELAAVADLLLIDAGNGLKPDLTALAAVADEVLLVTTPEPTALTATFAALARFRASGPGPTRPGLRVIVNQVRSRRQARDCLERLRLASREFLGLVVSPLGPVRADPRVPRAVRQRRPFLLAAPRSAAARDVSRLARALEGEHAARAESRPGLVATLAAHWRRAAACW